MCFEINQLCARWLSSKGVPLVHFDPVHIPLKKSLLRIWKGQSGVMTVPLLNSYHAVAEQINCLIIPCAIFSDDVTVMVAKQTTGGCCKEAI